MPTHNDNILDQFINNRSDQFVLQVAQSLVKTKQKAFIINSKANCVQAVSRSQCTTVTIVDNTLLVSFLLHQALANFNWGDISLLP